MTRFVWRLVSVAIALFFVGGSSAFASCNPGQIQCDKGYRYVCECWSDGGGCRYTQYGTCNHEDPNGPPALNLTFLHRGYIQQARFACPVLNRADAGDACTLD